MKKRRLLRARFRAVCIIYLASAIAAVLAPPPLYAQEALTPASYSGASSLVEKSDWMRYDNGKYIGHVYREVRASIVPAAPPAAPPAPMAAPPAARAPAPQAAAAPGTQSFKGNFFVMEDTLRDMRASARAVNTMVTVYFRMARDGRVEIENDRGFPQLRNFPVYQAGAVQPGGKWTAPGERALDPLNDGTTVIVPFLAEYEYKGLELYKDIPVHRVTARYASRYSTASLRPTGYNTYEAGRPQPFTGLSGKHEVDIFVKADDGALLFSRDTMDETFTWADGRTVRFRGFTLVFGQGIQPMNREALVAGIAPALDTVSGVQVTKVDDGVRLTIQDLQFKPDSADLLAGDTARLDIIAASLSKISGHSFLVEGHTAAAASLVDDEQLSMARAKRIVDELTARGIDAARFIYKGWGSSRPAANNDTEAGRKLNRRVEITIIE